MTDKEAMKLHELIDELRAKLKKVFTRNITTS